MLSNQCMSTDKCCTSLYDKMKPTLPRLVRIVPRSSISTEIPSFKAPVPEPIRSDIRSLSLIDVLAQRKVDLGSSYPANIRIEPVVPKKAFKDVPKEIRTELLKATKEW